MYYEKICPEDRRSKDYTRRHTFTNPHEFSEWYNRFQSRIVGERREWQKKGYEDRFVTFYCNSTRRPKKTCPFSKSATCKAKVRVDKVNLIVECDESGHKHELQAPSQQSSDPILHEQQRTQSVVASQQPNSIHYANQIYREEQCDQSTNACLLTMPLQQPSGAIYYRQQYKQQMLWNSTLTAEQMPTEDYSPCQQNETRSIQQQIDNTLSLYNCMDSISSTLQRTEHLLLPEISIVAVRHLNQTTSFFDCLNSKHDLMKKIARYNYLHYVTLHSVEPFDEDEVFVVEPCLSEHNLLVWSTRRLRCIQSKSLVLFVAIANIPNCNEFKLLIAGTTDSINEFYPTHLALTLSRYESNQSFFEFFRVLSQAKTYEPTVLYSINVDGIKQVAANFFPYTSYFCLQPYNLFFEASVDFGLPDCIVNQLVDDVSILCYCISAPQFKNVSELMIRKWTSEYGEVIHQFADHFQQLLKLPRFWLLLGKTSLNGFFSRSNRLVQYIEHLYDKFKSMRFSELAKISEGMIFERSTHDTREFIEVNKNIQRFSLLQSSLQSPNINFFTNPISTKKFLSINKQIFVFQNNEQPALTVSKMIRATQLIYGMEFESFDQFVEARFKVDIVNKVGDKLLCTCKRGFYNHETKCNHVDLVLNI